MISTKAVGQFLAGFDPSSGRVSTEVQVGGRAAWVLWRRAKLDRLVYAEERRQEPDKMLLGLLRAIELAALHYRQPTSEVTSGSGSDSAESPEVDPGSSCEGIVQLSASQAADLAGCSDRAIRQAAESGRLRGRRVGGRWLFERVDVDEWNERRSA